MLQEFFSSPPSSSICPLLRGSRPPKSHAPNRAQLIAETSTPIGAPNFTYSSSKLFFLKKAGWNLRTKHLETNLPIPIVQVRIFEMLVSGECIDYHWSPEKGYSMFLFGYFRGFLYLIVLHTFPTALFWLFNGPVIELRTSRLPWVKASLYGGWYIMIYPICHVVLTIKRDMTKRADISFTKQNVCQQWYQSLRPLDQKCDSSCCC